MKVFVITDARGNVESVAIPAEAVAGQVVMEAPAGRQLHTLDVDPRRMTRDDLLQPRSTQARTKVYAALRARIARTSRRG